MRRLNILWLTSWYPNKYDPFDGDFIQRHAKTAAIHYNIHVICVKEEEAHAAREPEKAAHENLTEHIIYFRTRRGLGKSVWKQLRWRAVFMKAVDDYIGKNGLPHMVHVHIPWKAGLIALGLKKRYGLPYVVTEHWGIYNTVVTDRFGDRPALVRKLLQIIIRESTALVSVSRYLGEAINAAGLKKKFCVIPNVVDTSVFFPGVVRQGVFTFIHVSNMAPLKNVQGLLRAYAQFRSASSFLSKLLLVGNRDNELSRYAESLGLLPPEVCFLGEIAYADVAREVNLAHCFILNSLIENAPCVISEAHCTGLPVIATAVGGIPEMITGGNGLLVPPSDDAALAAAMQQVQGSYELFRRETIAQDAAERYGTHAVAERFNVLYTQPAQ